MEHAKLLEDLDEVKQVVADEQSKYKTLQDTLVTSVEGVLDDELTCSICNEMFIKVWICYMLMGLCQHLITLYSEADFISRLERYDHFV